MMGESKSHILNMLPDSMIPKTLVIPAGQTDIGPILLWMKEYLIRFPIICKPDIGERGKRVEQIQHPDELKKYFEHAPFEVIVQEFIDLPKEVAILYYIFPGEHSGHITSICLKETLKIIGDGRQTVEALFQENPRARFQWQRLKKKIPYAPSYIPSVGESIEVEPIGNHCRGTKFLDGNHLIDAELVERFDKIHQHTHGIHYARYDLKYSSWEKLLNGEDFSILEINGVAGEPAHIYDPRHSIFYAYRTMFKQWSILLEISRIMKKKGHRSMNVREGLRTVKAFIQQQKLLSQ